MRMEEKEVQLELNRIYKIYDGCYRDLAKHFRLSEGCLWILYEMGLHGQKMTQADLCAALCAPRQSVNSTMKKMEAEGLITLSEADRHRRKLVTLTDAGRKLARGTADRIIEAEEDAAGEMGEPECSEFLRLYNRYVQILKGKIQVLKSC